MSDDAPAQILEVTGGVGGLAAAYDAVRALAITYDDAGSSMREGAHTGRRVLHDDDLLESSLLCPATFVLAEAAVLAATAGPDGLLVASAGWEVDAVAVRAAVAALETADQCVHGSVEVLDYALGRAVGTGLLLTSPLLLGGAMNALTGLALADQVRPGTSTQVLGGIAEHAEDQLTTHPAPVEHLVNGGGGLLDGLTGGLAGTATTEAGAAELAGLYDHPGPPSVTPVEAELPGSDTRPGSRARPRGAPRRGGRALPHPSSALNGTIEIQTISGQDGDRHIVYLPGTDDLTTLPWTQDGDVRDMATNAQLVAGQLDTYQQGVVQAMQDVGVEAGEPVLVVGHSQGGMEAAAILAADHGYDVTDVVTAGSPTAQVDGFPAGSHVTSLEQRGDIVPLLDGEPNPDSVQQTTVLFDAGPADGVMGHHSYGVYVAGAAAADASALPSLVENIDSLQAHGFLGTPGQPEEHVTSQVLQITRDRPVTGR